MAADLQQDNVTWHTTKTETRAQGVDWASKSNRASVGRAGTSQIHGGPQPSTYRTHRIHNKHPGARHNRKPTDLRRFGKCWQITYSVKMPRYHANTSPSSYKLNPSPSSKDNKKWIRLARTVDWTTHIQSRVNRGRAAKAPVWRTFNCCVIRRAQGCSSDYFRYIQRVTVCSRSSQRKSLGLYASRSN